MAAKTSQLDIEQVYFSDRATTTVEVSENVKLITHLPYLWRHKFRK